jgi:hypothetical protein
MNKMQFDLTGAAVASLATGNAWWHVVAPLGVAMVLGASWGLRPPSRVSGALFGSDAADAPAGW